MPLAQIVDPNWQLPPAAGAAPLANPYADPATANMTPDQVAALDRQQAAQQAAAPAPAAAPPQGVDYQAPAGQGGGTLYAMSPEEALRIGKQGAGAGRPAGWQPSARSETLEGRTASPELVDAYAQKLGADRQAGLAQADYDAAMGQAQGEAARRMAIIDAAQAREDERRQADTMAKLAQDRQNITQAMNDASKAYGDPEREFWEKRGPLGSALTIIGMALKGFVVGFSGRGEDPSEMLNKQIQQSVEESKARVMAARGKVADMNDLYAKNLQAYGDADRAALATEATKRANLMGALQQRIADATAPQVERLRGAQLYQKLADQQAQTLEQFWDKTADKHTTKADETYRPATGGAAQDPLVQLRRAVEAQELAGKLGNNLPTRGAAAELEGKELGAQKTAAELAAQGKPDESLSDAAREVKSTAYSPLRGIQGTESHEKKMGQDAFNAALEAAAVKKFGARGAQQVIQDLRIDPGDTDSTIALKRQHALRLLSGASSSIQGVTPGVAPGEGEE